ncbi:MAG TPA: polyphosphate kinase 2 family protein [Chthoniobacterales bacterium]|nr:polyphosphate kinase 2 family protein [Chthoniobacterales bacterium]
MKSTKQTHAPPSADGATKLQPIRRARAAGEGIVVVRRGEKVRLADIDPGAKPAASKEEAAERVETLRARLAELQGALYAEHKRSLLMVVQAMDTGGKDGAIKKICSGLDPNGVQLTNFKVPSSEERDHDFLWRIHANAPRKGSIGIWNRSHYEDVLVPRVHKQIDEQVWRERCEDINAFERLLCRNGVTLLKFFLHISKEEQKARLQARLRVPQKLWKFNSGDLKERALWAEYQRAYEDAINECATDCAPWHIVPADRKWVRNWWMLETVVRTLEGMDPQYPPAEFDPKKIVIE